MNTEEFRRTAHKLLTSSRKEELRRLAKDLHYKTEGLPSWVGNLSLAYYAELAEKHNRKKELELDQYFG